MNEQPEETYIVSYGEKEIGRFRATESEAGFIMLARAMGHKQKVTVEEA